eukprot:CAMPEP_0206290276 /NCGR_PEP_ID=MMETSP0106_2-20121207/2538_1 /ASSEMBLY_ACC=CAM_ASM_000206 /TAXON_ID=81532 /ORGANISM="Acanthoeca-like sp., Strain 10tr" /LENGTH=255 /DNA_ID=CAMNT_0053720835 /DNA_START=33 /DNA_END=798 /DNA_ORIENTATION=+
MPGEVATLFVAVGAVSAASPSPTPPRHVAWWRPVGCGSNTSCQTATVTSLRRRYGAYDTFSPTVGRVYNGTAAIDLEPLSADVLAAIATAAQIGYRVVPMLEVDCGKVVGDATKPADYAPVIKALSDLAARHTFDGYTLDMICGDLRKTANTTTARFVDFVNTLHAELGGHRPGAVVNWFAHGGYHPDAAEPNSGFSEDTYRCERIEWTVEGIRGWVDLLKHKAGIGLEPSPTVYFEAAALHTLFATLAHFNVSD